MRTSQVVEEWRNEGRLEGKLEACRDMLQDLLEHRFGPLTDDLIQRIQGLKDLERLKACLLQMVHIQSLDELQL
jgi:hypothetical protein